MAVYQLRWCVQGYHVYRDKWDAATGEELECVREKNNLKDSYAVAMMCDKCSCQPSTSEDIENMHPVYEEERDNSL